MITLNVTVAGAEPWPIDFDTRGLGFGHSLLDGTIFKLEHFRREQGGIPNDGGANPLSPENREIIKRFSAGGRAAAGAWVDTVNTNDFNGRVLLAEGNERFVIGTESVPMRHVQSGSAYDRATDSFASPLARNGAFPGDTCDPRAWILWYNEAVRTGSLAFFVWGVWYDLRGGQGGALESAYAAEDAANPYTDTNWRTMCDIVTPWWEEIVNMLQPGSPTRGNHPALAPITNNPNTDPLNNPDYHVIGDIPVYLIPGAQLFARLYDEVQLGNAPAGLDAFSLTDYSPTGNSYFEDSIHPTNPVGQYAAAALMSCVLYNQVPVGLDGDTVDIFGNPYPSITQAQADYLIDIADQVARAHPLTGR